jgi:putative endonuclease
MKTQQQKVGKIGEDMAVKYLKKKKYKILERNYRADKFGEIDIIAQDKNELVFVEVKTKTDQNFGLPEQELTYQKKKRLKRAIQNYLFKKYLTDADWRMDLIAIEFLNSQPEIRHYQGIFL